MPSKDEKTKKVDVEATKMMRAATALKEDSTASDLRMPAPLPVGGDVDEALLGAFQQQVVHNSAKAAVNMAKTESLESEIKLKKAEIEHKALDNPHPANQSPFGGSGLGGSNSRAAIINGLISSFEDPVERAAFIKDNKDALLAPDTPYGSLFAKAKGGNGGNGNSPMEMAAVMATLGEEQRAALAFALQMANQGRQNQPAPVQQPQQDPMSMVKMVMDMQNNMITSLGTILKAPLDELRNEIKSLKEQKPTGADDSKWQERWLTTQQELLQIRSDTRDKEIFEAIAQLQQRPNDANMIPISQFKNISAMFKDQMGMTVGATDVRTDEIRRKWDNEDRKLTIQESREEREHQEKLADIELQKQNREVLKTIASGALELHRIGDKVLAGGSKASNRVSSRRS